MRHHFAKIITILATITLLTACAPKPPHFPSPEAPVSSPTRPLPGNINDGPPDREVNLSLIHDAIPKFEPKQTYGNPSSYIVMGQRYYVRKSNKGFHATGIASWYGTKFQDHLTSSGEIYDMFRMTAANKTLRLPAYVRVTNLENGRRVIVKVNDRGPFHKDRIIDLSYVAARKLGITARGTGLVSVAVIEPNQLRNASTKTIVLPKHMKPEIYLQLGAYTSRDHARITQLQAKRVIKNFPTEIYAYHHGQQTLYHVQVGPIANVANADITTLALKKASLPAPMTVIKEVPVPTAIAARSKKHKTRTVAYQEPLAPTTTAKASYTNPDLA